MGTSSNAISINFFFKLKLKDGNLVLGPFYLPIQMLRCQNRSRKFQFFRGQKKRVVYIFSSIVHVLDEIIVNGN